MAGFEKFRGESPNHFDPIQPPFLLRNLDGAELGGRNGMVRRLVVAGVAFIARI
jgi:hypothetical protein